MMNKNKALVIAGLIFLFMTIAHLVRALLGIEIIVSNYVIPIWWSFIGAAVTLILSILMLIQSRK